MKLHHAAALALVGWYLMAPPTRRIRDEAVFDDDQPLSQWKQIGTYDTAKECTARIDYMQTLPLAEEIGAAFVRCIASDDPRLKSN